MGVSCSKRLWVDRQESSVLHPRRLMDPRGKPRVDNVSDRMGGEVSVAQRGSILMWSR